MKTFIFHCILSAPFGDAANPAKPADWEEQISVTVTGKRNSLIRAYQKLVGVPMVRKVYAVQSATSSRVHACKLSF